MRLRYFLIIIVLICVGHIARADNHSQSTKLAEEFAIAVKNVESKNFLEAVRSLTSLPRAVSQKLSLTFHFYILAVWVLQKIIKRLSIGLGRHI